MSTFMQSARQHIMPTSAASTRIWCCTFYIHIYMWARGLLLCFYRWVYRFFFSLTSLFTPRSIAAARLNARVRIYIRVRVHFYFLSMHSTHSVSQSSSHGSQSIGLPGWRAGSHSTSLNIRLITPFFTRFACKNIYSAPVCVCVYAPLS